MTHETHIAAVSAGTEDGTAAKGPIDPQGGISERAAPIQCGDTVLHRPSGEIWLVAAADHERNTLMWCGWPEGTASITDCKILHRAKPEESRRLHLRLSGARRIMADRVYGNPESPPMTDAQQPRPRRDHVSLS
jgi:hypothetical protein